MKKVLVRIGQLNNSWARKKEAERIWIIYDNNHPFKLFSPDSKVGVNPNEPYGLNEYNDLLKK